MSTHYYFLSIFTLFIFSPLVPAQNVFVAGPKTDQMIRRLTGGLVSCSGLKFKEEDLGRTFVVTSGAKGDAASAFTLAQCDRYGVPLEGHLTEKMAEKTSSSVKATNTKAKNPAPVRDRPPYSAAVFHLTVSPCSPFSFPRYHNFLSYSLFS